MRKVFWLARREYLASVKTKGFIIGLIVAPIFMSGSGIAIWLLKDRVDTTDQKLVVIDHSTRVAPMLMDAAEKRNEQAVFDEETGEKIRPAYVLEVAKPDSSDLQAQRLALSDRIRRKEIHAFLEIGPEVVNRSDDPELSRITYHSRTSAMDNLRSWLNYPINGHLRKLRLAERGVERDSVDKLLYWINVESMGLISVEKASGTVKKAQRTSELQTILAPLIGGMLMLLMVMMGALPLLQSTMEEKTKRIAEVLLGSVKPFQFMLGKLLGGAAVSLTGALVYAILGIAITYFLGWSQHMPYHLLPWFFGFMLLAIMMYGSLFAALGAACGDVKDAQSMTFPGIVPVMIPMFVMLPIIKEPLSGFSTALSLIPLFTPTVMIMRLGTPAGIPLWQPWVGLLGVMLLTVVFVWAGGRIFRTAILLQGARAKVSQLLRWAVKG